MTEGNGGSDKFPSWGIRLSKMLKTKYSNNSNIRLVNGARGATTSAFMSLCLGEHVPQVRTALSSADLLRQAYGRQAHMLPDSMPPTTFLPVLTLSV